FIASQIVDAYIAEEHNVTIIDDLSTGFEENLNPAAKFVKQSISEPGIIDLFKKEKFDLVNHHAAQIDVRKSVADPMFDASINILGTINLLQSCVKTGVKKIIFSSTGGAIYGEQEYFPADETHPTSPISPYGITKLTSEKYLYFYNLEHKLHYTILRYANVYGPRQNPFGEAGVVAIFANKLLLGEQPVINGSGAQTRDYVFVDDVVKANLLAVSDEQNNIYNVGTAIETNVNVIYKILNDVIGKGMVEKHGPAAQGEQMRSVITSEKLYNKFNWKPATLLKEGLEKTADYFRDKT
ncbi:MAG: NAD-dependent epimerase/dehydratase family protein, partial [Ignavibacteria bacterium]|nr:NAD-dependent epimerase/dehydratase family protein [Ignavibacteria bacterium]